MFQHNDIVNDVAFSPDGRWLATASDDGTAVIWDMATELRLHEYRHRELVSALAFSPDGRWLATSSRDGTASVNPIPPELLNGR